MTENFPSGHNFYSGPTQWDAVMQRLCQDLVCVDCGGAFLADFDATSDLPRYDPESHYTLELENKLHRLDDRDSIYPYDRLRAGASR